MKNASGKQDRGAAGDEKLIDAARGQVEEARQGGREEASPAPTLAASAAEPSFSDPPPDSFTGYKITREIHRGGQGVVYQAIQESTKRKVAIKVMKEGPFADSADRARFDREVQVLGQLNHPNIVSVHDTGTAAGHFYFVMDYISGQPLDVHMAGADHSIDDTLKLFGKICDAVNAAHLRGVIHRDLKPSNIRVDDSGEPHILDFGLAKVAVPTGPESGPTNVMTLTGQFIGSLPWASPEQAEATPAKIDVRTDVYSLGVVLYQMLTGKFPYEVIGNMRDVLDRIMNAEPARPSMIRKKIDDEVETIVLKCLSKERERRYQTAGVLADDVKRYLAGEPIEAKRDSGWYLIRKSLRRYRVRVTVAAAFVPLLGGSTVALSIMHQNQTRERQRAEAARDAEGQQRRIAEDANRQAQDNLTLAERREQEATEARELVEQRADQLRKVTDFQASMLSEIDPHQMGRGIFADLRGHIREALEAAEAAPAALDAALASFDETVKGVNATDLALKVVDEHVLSRAVESIEREFTDQPLVEAALRQTVADTYRDLGMYPQAKTQQERALEGRRRVLGDDHPDTLTSINNMGALLGMMGKLAEVEPYYREALEGHRRVLGDDHPDTLISIDNMGHLLRRMGKYDTAMPYYREALEGQRRVLGDDHPDTLTSINNMGFLLQSMGKLADAEPYVREALETKRRVLGDDHPSTLISINSMGGLLESMGKLAEAEAYYREALEGRRRVLGDNHSATLRSINNMGLLLKSTGKLDEAEPYFHEALEGKRRVLGDDHPSTLTSINNMGFLLRSMGKPAEAEPYYREALEARRRVLGDDHRSTLTSIHNMGRLLRDLGRLEEAEALGAEAVRGARAKLAPSHPLRLAALAQHGRTLAATQRFTEAEAELLEAYEGYVKTRGPDDRRATGAAQGLADLYTAWHAAEPGKGYDRKVAEWRAKLGTEFRSGETSEGPEPTTRPAPAP